MTNKFNSLSKNTKALIILTGILLLYGYLCRLLEIYFFWESKSIGWSLVFITVIFLLRERIQLKKTQNKKTVSEKVAIGLMIFVLTIQSVLLIIIPQLDVYKTSRAFLQSDKSVSNEVGEVTSIVIIPMGSFSSSSGSEGESGQAILYFIVKGKTKYKDYNLQLEKEVNSDWIIVNMK